MKSACKTIRPSLNIEPNSGRGVIFALSITLEEDLTPEAWYHHLCYQIVSVHRLCLRDKT